MPKTTIKAKTKTKTLAEELEAQRVDISEAALSIEEPVWKGPYVDGITQSMIQSFLNCRHRFWVDVILGLKVPEGFVQPIEYGNMWHICREVYNNTGDIEETHAALKKYAAELGSKYPLQIDEVVKWFKICKVQFEVYLEYIKGTTADRGEYILEDIGIEEHTFAEPFEVPGYGNVIMRGKMDGASWITYKKKQPGGFKEGLILEERKTKSANRLDPNKISTQLQYDLQTMYYLTALCSEKESWELDWAKSPYEVFGIHYDCVLRPLSGGKGSIRRHQATKNKPEETWEHFLYGKGRLRDIIKEEPDRFFPEWIVRVTPTELAKFQQECLIPILTQICEWWEWIQEDFRHPFRKGNKVHWLHPFGLFNAVNEGYTQDVDNFIKTGDTTGLIRQETLFGELA